MRWFCKKSQKKRCGILLVCLDGLAGFLVDDFILVLPGSKPSRLRIYSMVADLLPFVKPYFENIPNQKKSPRPEPGAILRTADYGCGCVGCGEGL